MLGVEENVALCSSMLRRARTFGEVADVVFERLLEPSLNQFFNQHARSLIEQGEGPFVIDTSHVEIAENRLFDGCGDEPYGYFLDDVSGNCIGGYRILIQHLMYLSESYDCFLSASQMEDCYLHINSIPNQILYFNYVGSKWKGRSADMLIGILYILSVRWLQRYLQGIGLPVPKSISEWIEDNPPTDSASYYYHFDRG